MLLIGISACTVTGCDTDGTDCTFNIGSQEIHIIMTKYIWEDCQTQCASKKRTFPKIEDPWALAHYLRGCNGNDILYLFYIYTNWIVYEKHICIHA